MQDMIAAATMIPELRKVLKRLHYPLDRDAGVRTLVRR